ncbi:SCA7, zinc-binding domain-containing protein [Russula earlei]|uniref:SCA7, zinc-binding domain-containing protein n=1 Tax=Russula earlei TaxID=71964 RepID=A0ACC0U3U9_9AGAM|nr:SCA7, zinc-binding domain-containing protein [Russula earlei]
MTIKLRIRHSPSPAPFSFDILSSTPPSPPSTSLSPLPPPTSWLSARDMKIFGADPLRSTSEIGIVQCKDCAKPILRSVVAEHADNCKKYDFEKNGPKGKADDAKGKKRKGEDFDPNDPSAPKSKKAKAATKVTKGRFKGPFNPDRHCGVINDKGLPCSRSLTCKSHSMGAKRAVQGRSKDYDVLLLEWNRAHNPNWVEPVKRESKKERKEKKEREKRERKQREVRGTCKEERNRPQQAGSRGTTRTTQILHQKEKEGAGAHPSGSNARVDDEHGTENLADLDSEEELESIAKSVRLASEACLLGVPLAIPSDAGSWFVVRRERLRTCRDLFAGALMKGGASSVGAAGAAARLGTGTG